MKLSKICLALMLCGALSTSAYAGRALINPVEVKAQVAEKKAGQDYKLFEVSWGEEKDSPDYLKGHIPGAVHFNTDLVEEGPVWNYRPFDQMSANLAKMGVTVDTPVVLYGDMIPASRVALAMLWAGVKDVKVINGGLKTWEAQGGELETESNSPVAAESFGADKPQHPEYVLSLEQVREKMKDDPNFRLVSIRSKPEFDGQTSGYTYIPKAGEPDGAVWGHAGSDSQHLEDYLHPDGTVITVDEMNKLWSDRGFSTNNELSFYCGTGWRACVPWLIMFDQGLSSTLYDGGWNEWQMQDQLPAQVGDPQSGDVKTVKVGDLSPDKALKK